MPTSKHIIDRLRSQFSRGEPVLFTGAGFSLEANSQIGTPMPSSVDLTHEFWKLAFAHEPFAPNTRLGDAFHAALTSDQAKIRRLIQDRLSVDAESLPSFYQQWFAMPWSRYYTLNIDDLELAVMRRYSLTRSVMSISATSGRKDGLGAQRVDHLECIHLNGLVGDELHNLTFSSIDYGSRQATPDPWMIQVATDVVTRPVVFVGTELDEPTLWQYLEYRKQRGSRGTRELRPGSLLISPTLNSARRIILRQLNIEWIEMNARHFAEDILSEMTSESEKGHTALRSKRRAVRPTAYPPLVSDLITRKMGEKTDYLMGQEPDWEDILSDRATQRSCDPEIYNTARRILTGESPAQPVIITGTAGSGKSSSLMRLGLAVSADGVATHWIDEETNFDVHKLREIVSNNNDPIAVLVDDADMFGRLTTGWAKQLPGMRERVLFACAMRASKVDGLLDKDTLAGVEPIEFSMPLLGDHDIDSLIQILDSANRLGILKGASDANRRNAFRKEAGRQILVGMLQATSGLKFTEKAIAEYSELKPLARMLYGIITLVHSQRYSLTLDEVLTAAGSVDNETINELDRLVRRGLVTRKDRYVEYRTRHRVISEQIVNSQAFRRDVKEVIEGLFVALSSTLGPALTRSNRIWRRYIRIINHEFVLLFLDTEDGRVAYETIESFMSWDYHYWLQRGSLEVQEGDLDKATNYLGQAQSLAPGDRLVQTECAYLLMKKAAHRPTHMDAKAWFAEGFDKIVGLIADRDAIGPHPYHILGSQTIAWVRSANLSLMEERTLLGNARDIVDQGLRKNPRSNELKNLRGDLQQKWLLTAV